MNIAAAVFKEIMFTFLIRSFLREALYLMILLLMVLSQVYILEGHSLKTKSGFLEVFLRLILNRDTLVLLRKAKKGFQQASMTLIITRPISMNLPCSLKRL